MLQRIQNAVGRSAAERTDGGSDTTDTRTGTSDDQELDAPDFDGTSRGDAAVEDAAADAGVDIGAVFDVLRNERRRAVIRDLQSHSDTVAVGELAERIAARECGKPVGRLESAERKRVYIALYQNHLPRMADARAVEYDQRGGSVERGPEFPRFTEHLPSDGEQTADEGTPGFVQRLASVFR